MPAYDLESASLTWTLGNTIHTPEELAKKVQDPWVANQEEEEAHKRIMWRVESEMKMARQMYEDEWDNAREIYEAYIPNDVAARSGRKSNLKIPLSHMITESALAEEIDAFPDIEIDTQEEDDKLKIPILNACKKYALNRTKWEKVKMKALRLRRIYGFSVVRISYVRETRIVHERIPLKNDDGLLSVGFREAVDHPYDDIKIEVIEDPYRFYVDDMALDIDDAVDCALITEMSWQVFQKTFQHDKRFKNINFVKPGAYYAMHYGSGKWVYPDNGEINERKKVKVMEYWNEVTDEYVVIANGIIIRQDHLVDDHKRLPFAVMHMYRRPKSFCSKGVPKLIESIEAAYNALISAELQATKLAFPIITTSEDSGIDPKAVAHYPGVVFDGAMDKMKLEKLGSVPAEAYQLKAKLEELLIWVTGVNYQNVFGDQSSRVGIEALKKESMLSRINLNLRENEVDFVVRIGNLLIQDIMQYYKTPKVRALVSPEERKSLQGKSLKKDGRELIYGPGENGQKEVKGIIEYRKIMVDGFSIKETTSEGIFTLKNLGSGNSGAILARPEYIRTKFDVDVRAVRPSAMGSSKEAKKLMLMEIANHALTVNGSSPPDKPVYDMSEFAKLIAEINDLTPKVLSATAKDVGDEAKKALEEAALPFMGNFKEAPAPEAPPAPGAAMAGPAPLSPVEQNDFQSMTL